MRDESIDHLAWTSFPHVLGPVRGLILRFNGLGAAGMRSGPEAADLEWGTLGGLVIECHHNPWGWMNDATRELYDAVVDGVRVRHGLTAELPLIVTGGSMGGHAALTYAFTSRHRVTACQANFPVCDLPFHFSERPDLPRTLYSAYGLADGIEQRLAAHSPLHQVARLPSIPYQILHGMQDVRVSKVRHSDALVAAMYARGLQVEYLEEPEMGHGGPLPSYALLRRLITFVSGQLATPAQSVVVPPGSAACAGFTLLELLIVVAILALLSSMLFPLVAIAKRQAKVANTRAVMLKVDQAIRQFRTDMRTYPWQTDLGTAPAEADQWGNNLAWRLAWNPPPAGSGTPTKPDKATYLGKVQQDLCAVSRCFTFVNGCNVPPAGDKSEGSHAFRNEFQSNSSRTNLLPANGTLQYTTAQVSGLWLLLLPGTSRLGNDCSADARALTQIAEQITKLAYLAGQMPVLAPSGIDATQAADKARAQVEDERYPGFTVSTGPTIPYRYLPYNKPGYYGDDSRGPALTSATAQAQGWRGDYLTAALKTERSSGQRADVDASGNAVVDAWGNPLVYVCTVRPGVHGQLQALSASLYDGAREERYNMGPQGRTATTTLASDIRTTAAAPYVLEFELWSAGPDGRFSGARDASINRDNIALLPYLKGLQ